MLLLGADKIDLFDRGSGRWLSLVSLPASASGPVCFKGRPLAGLATGVVNTVLLPLSGHGVVAIILNAPKDQAHHIYNSTVSLVEYSILVLSRPSPSVGRYPPSS